VDITEEVLQQLSGALHVQLQAQRIPAKGFITYALLIQAFQQTWLIHLQRVDAGSRREWQRLNSLELIEIGNYLSIPLQRIHEKLAGIFEMK
jgi:hypothetical protein